MSTYTVKRVADSPREWTSKQGGTFLSYTVDLDNEETGAIEAGVEWNRKPESQAPQVGDRIAGTVEPGKFSERFKMDYEATKELGSGGGTARASGGEARGGYQKSPDQQASIVRQHSQESALRFAAATGSLADLDLADEGLIRNILDGQFKPVIDWFVEDANNASKAAGGGGDGTTSGAPSAAPPQATHEDLHGLLERAGLNPNAARVVTDFALTNMSAEEQDAALEMLGNENRAEAAVRRLSEKAEAHYGSPLPSADPDDDIPF